MKSVSTILVVDDDPLVCEVVKTTLGHVGYQVIIVDNGDAMFEALATQPITLVILDLILPGEDGMQLAKDLRAQSTVPLIMMTGKGDETDKILGLEIAADDFIMKPFNSRELLARVRSLVRRTEELSIPVARRVDRFSGPRVSFNGWVANLGLRELINPQGEVVSLTFGEFNLLETFLKNPNVILNRDQLIEKTHRESEDVFDRTIDVLILRLRRKIEANPSNPSVILTERGLGYIFKANVVAC